jgi:DNA-directed RNA polymerase
MITRYLNIEVNVDRYDILCGVINKLQEQPFEINSVWLKTIKEYREGLSTNAYIMPAFLAEANHRKSIDTMIEVYGDEALLYEYWDSSELQAMLKKNIQIASCEQVFLYLAESLEGSNIYFPAFLYFRGRIYRSGLLHFHERDLSRSLVMEK